MDKNLILGKATLLVFFVSLILAFFLFTVKSSRANKMSNRLMGFFLSALLLHISVFFYSSYFYLPLVLEQLRDQLILFFAPLLYLYFISSIYLDFKLETKHLVHLTPFLLATILFLPRFFLVPDFERGVFYRDSHSQIETKIYAAISIISAAVYVVLIIRELEKYRRSLGNNYSAKRYSNYKWLKHFSLLVTLFFVLSFCRTLVVHMGNDQIVLIVRTLHTILLLSFISWLMLKSLYSPELFTSTDIKHLRIREFVHGGFNQTNAPGFSGEGEIKEEISKLQYHIQHEKPYLSPTLTIKELADDLHMKPQDLSFLINKHIGKHFFDFINEHRIEMALQILKDPERRSSHILEIQYEVGFNSKSAFHRAFKKHTGKTPKQYRSESEL